MRRRVRCVCLTEAEDVGAGGWFTEVRRVVRVVCRRVVHAREILSRAPSRIRSDARCAVINRAATVNGHPALRASTRTTSTRFLPSVGFVISFHTEASVYLPQRRGEDRFLEAPNPPRKDVESP